MKAQDLRIGNIVNLKGFDKNYTVSETYKEAIIEAFEGVPLTPKWLERAGFVKTYAKDCYKKPFHEFSEHYLCVTLAKDGNIFALIDNYSTKEFAMVFTGKVCQYVHELQNLFYALTGKELEFNLDNLN